MFHFFRGLNKKLLAVGKKIQVTLMIQNVFNGAFNSKDHLENVQKYDLFDKRKGGTIYCDNEKTFSCSL